MKKSYDYFEKYLIFLKKHGLYPTIYTVDGPSFDPNVEVNGRKYVSFCSNNYLGLAGNEEVKKVVVEGVKTYGVGSGSTRLLAGNLDVQVKLEKSLADFFGYDEAITFSSGYLANVGVIRMLVEEFPYFSIFGGKEGVIISDELNHASIIDGARLAKAERVRYAHSDMKALEKALENNKRKRKLIITDGVFSMDGDLAKLVEIAALAKRHDALLMVDDSHGIGVLGSHGEGTAQHLGVSDGVDVLMGSFTKAFGNIGGFVAVNKTLSEYLRITARSFIFSDPIPPALVAGLMEQVSIIKNGDELRRKVITNAEHLRGGLKGAGFTVLGEQTSIVPLLVGDEKKAIKFSEALFEAGILAPCIRRPAVVEGKERLRFSVMATHTIAHVDILLSACEKIGKSLKLI